ncbi:MAG: metallophosphoesterase family protein [Candidatus Gastranaerophilaceae bacterium]
MRIAVISDIHGNMQALEAVLNDIEQGKCSKIFCLGDLAMAGSEPVEAIELIKKLYDEGKLELIQGNTDEIIGNYSPEILAKVGEAFPIMGAALEDDAKIIPQNLKEFLKDLPKQKELEIEGVKILLVHGSPRKNDENIAPDLQTEKVEEMLDRVNAEVIFCGHTHIPCGYQTSGKQTVVNVGSVGRPFTPIPQACYVVAEFHNGEFELMHKFVDYDKQKASEILAKRNFKGADKLSKILIKPEFRHM